MEHRSTRPSRLTPAGRQALEEYLTAERSRILTEARTLSRNGAIGASEIVNAYGAIAERDRLGRAFYPSQRSTASPLLLLVTSLGLLVGLSGIVVGLVVQLGHDSGSKTGGGLLAILAGAGFGVLLGVFTLLYSRRLRWRFPPYEAFEARPIRPKWSIMDSALRDYEWSLSSALQADTPSRQFARANNFSLEMEFIARWRQFERLLRELAVASLGLPESDATRYPIGEMLRQLEQSGVIDAAFYESTRACLAVRNAVLHEASTPQSKVALATKNLETLTTRVRSILNAKHDS